MQNGFSRNYIAENRLLRLCLEACGIEELFSESLSVIRQITGCAALGYRVRQGGWFPFVESSGFPESYLNDSAQRLVCFESGFDSLAVAEKEITEAAAMHSCIILPVFDDGKTVAALQLCDEAAGFFTGELRPVCEDLAGLIGRAHARISAQRTYVQHEDYLREIERIAKIGKWVLDTRDNTLEWSDSVYELFETSPAVFTPDMNGLIDFVPEQDRDILLDARDAALHDVKIFRIMHRIQMADGRIKWVKQAGHSVVDPESGVNRIIGTIQDITDLKNMEKALHHSLSSAQLIFETVPVGIGITSMDGIQLEANAAMEQLFGYSRNRMKGSNVKGLYVHESDREKLVEEMKAKGQLRDYKVEFRRNNGELMSALLNVDMLDLPEGKAMLVTVRDVTESIRAAESLRASEKKYRILFNSISVGVVISDPEGRILDTNNTLCDMFILSESELQGRLLSDLCENRSQDCRALFEKFKREGRLYKREQNFIRKDGSRMVCALNMEKIDEIGRDVILVVFSDITAQKAAEESFRRSYDLLTNLASRVPGVLFQHRFMPAGGSAIQYVSPGIETLYGLSVDEALRDGEIMLNKIHPEDFGWVLDLIGECNRKLSFLHAEYRIVGKDDRVIWVSCDAKPLALEDGGILWHGIIIDIDERKKSDDERDRLRVQLNQSQRMEFIGRLAGGVAHDFNNLLTVIMTNAEIALMSGVDPAHGGEELGEIKKAATRAAELTRQLLAVARKQVIEPVQININEAIANMLRMMERLIGENITLEWEPAQTLWLVKMDPVQLDQIMVNLVVNARDAIRGAGTIHIATRNLHADNALGLADDEPASGDYVLITIGDSGSGMSDEVIEHIFEPFFTTKTVGKGTGLGLATVYGAVKQNRGYIHVYSEIGTGSTFRIYLPRVADFNSESAETPDTGISAGTETVLIVEDEVSILNIARSVLMRFGYHVLGAASPGEALRIAAENKEIDLLITDIVMPEMNGRELAERISREQPAISIIYVSGYSADIVEHQGVVEAGVNFLHKPFSVKELLDKVRSVLDAIKRP